MNTLFGTASYCTNHVKEPFDTLRKSVEELYDAPVEVLGANHEFVKAGFIDDGGCILGTAIDNGVSLVYLGGLDKPLPDWNGASPVDAPDETARYLLDRYMQYGAKFLNKICGQYVVFVIDPRENRALLACDPCGLRTVFYRMTGTALTFGSNLFSLGQGLGSSRSIDRSFEDFFLIYGFFPFERTPYEDVFSLPAGTILDWKQGEVKFHKIENGDPWNGKFTPKDYSAVTEDEAVDILYDAFMLAVEEQLTSAERVGVLLGGFDSGLVAAALHRFGKKVETFSFYFDDPMYNQPSTELLSSHLGTKHHWIPISVQTIREGLEEFSSCFNYPTNWANYVIQTKEVCQVMREMGISHCYSGDGCDGVFLGYPGVAKRASWYHTLGRMSDRQLKLWLQLFGSESVERITGRPYIVLLNVLRTLSREMPERGHLTFRIFDELCLDRLRDDEAPKQKNRIEDTLKDLTGGFNGMSFHRLAYLGKAAVSPNRSKLVGSSDSSGTIILSPFLHQGFKALAKSLPDELCRPTRKTKAKEAGKYILMKMAEDKNLLPQEFIYQKKMAAVDAPIDNWLAGPLRKFLYQQMDQLPFRCNKSYLDNMLRPKLSEKIYKEFLSTDHVVTHGASLLASYASFTRKH